MRMFTDAHPTQTNIATFYDQMTGEAYDDFLVRINYVDPYNITEAIYAEAPADGSPAGYGFLNTARDASILDVGQGTGIMGKLLKAQGFNDIQGADASTKFNEVGRATGAYKECREVWFGRGVDQLPRDFLMRFDVVMGSGIFMDGHIPAAGFDDVHAMCKTGGHFITSMRKVYYQDGHEYGYKEKLDSLVRSGKFEWVKDWTFKRGVAGAEDPLFVEMDSFMYILKRLD